MKDSIQTSDQHPVKTPAQGESNWAINAAYFLDYRRLFLRVMLSAFLFSIIVAYFVLPKTYESSARIMPPEQGGNSMAMLAALIGKGTGSIGGSGAGGGLAGLAGSLLGVKNNGALFVALLKSGTVGDHLIDRFGLLHVYHKRYRTDAAKKLLHSTTITEDTKSGVITIVVKDKNPYRARDLAQGYLDELNSLVAKVNTSSAHREREFVEQRLKTVQSELQQAQVGLSEFSTKNTTIDVKEQTRAMVDVGAKLQGQLILGESELNSLRQVYGNSNVRVKAAEARNALLKQEIQRESGTGDLSDSSAIDVSHPYPALRQLPRLGVGWANLYRDVRIHETVFELLSEEYEMARIEEVKSIPSVSVIDAPGVPEKKSGPYRVLIVLISTLLSAILTGAFLLAKRSWLAVTTDDPRRILASRLLSYLPKLRDHIAS